MKSSSTVGCQLIGSRRWSNFLELLSFHLRKTVQMIATPPTDAATTMSTVIRVVFPVELRLPPLEAEFVSTEFCAVAVDVKVT